MKLFKVGTWYIQLAARLNVSNCILAASQREHLLWKGERYELCKSADAKELFLLSHVAWRHVAWRIAYKVTLIYNDQRELTTKLNLHHAETWVRVLNLIQSVYIIIQIVTSAIKKQAMLGNCNNFTLWRVLMVKFSRSS